MDATEARAIAGRLVAARRQARALDGFPGEAPRDMAQAYAIQDAGLDLWPGVTVGWKLGRIAPEHETRLGAGRLAGPIFAGGLSHAGEPPAVAPVFQGGFAAVEAEYVLRLRRDVAPTTHSWSLEAAAEVVDAMFIGVEMAGSPIPDINALGPTVVTSDFGNNAGLILGWQIEDWRDRPLESLTCETRIDGQVVGRGGAAAVPNGPLDSVRFLLELLGRRGRPLSRGDLVSTGAATGIHEVKAGQSAVADFGRDGAIRLITKPAEPAG